MTKYLQDKVFKKIIYKIEVIEDYSKSEIAVTFKTQMFTSIDPITLYTSTTAINILAECNEIPEKQFNEILYNTFKAA